VVTFDISGRLALTVRVAALAVLAATLGCNSNICAGVATCYGDRQSQCQNVPGCAPTPGCMVNPVVSQDCPTAATQDACLVLAGCSFSNGVCSGPCSVATDMATCQSTPGCSWSACMGKPKSCGAYSADSCPTSPIGCYVTASPNGVIGE
jgi:hypothetical protein